MPSPRREAGINRAEIVPFTVVIPPKRNPMKYADKEQRLIGMANRYKAR